MWFQLPHTENDIFPRFTVTFAILLQWVFFPFLDSLFTFPLSQVQLRKELGVGAYQLSAWFLAKTTVGLLPFVAWPLVHVTILFWMANTNSNGGGPFVVSLALVYLTVILYQSMGLLLSAALAPGRIMTVALLLITAMFLFTGIFIPLEATPIPWIGYINPLLYCLQAISNVTIGWGMGYTCNDDRVGTSYPNVCSGKASATISPERALARNGVFASLELSVGVMAIYTVGLRLLAYRALRQRMRDPSPDAGPRTLVGALLYRLRTKRVEEQPPSLGAAPADERAAKSDAASSRV